MLLSFVEINSVNVVLVEKNPVPKNQTKPFYIGTKEAPSETCLTKILQYWSQKSSERSGQNLSHHVVGQVHYCLERRLWEYVNE